MCIFSLKAFFKKAETYNIKLSSNDDTSVQQVPQSPISKSTPHYSVALPSLNPDVRINKMLSEHDVECHPSFRIHPLIFLWTLKALCLSRKSVEFSIKFAYPTMVRENFHKQVKKLYLNFFTHICYVKPSHSSYYQHPGRGKLLIPLSPCRRFFENLSPSRKGEWKLCSKLC